MNNEIIKKEKLTSIEEVTNYYEKKIKRIKEQNALLKHKALDTSAPGGYINTYLTRGVNRTPFTTPYAQSIIAEEMANEGYFALALKQFTALCRKVNVKLSYRNKDRLNDVKYLKVLNYVEEQIKNVGGWDGLFRRVVAPALRWGVGLGIPILKIEGSNIVFDGVQTVNMQNIQQFVFDSDNPSKIHSVKYLTYPKMTNENDSTADLVEINFDDNCVAYYAYGAEEGNPFGTFYLYFLYSHYKTYKRITDSIYSSVLAYGNYPVGVKRTNRDSGDDNTDWEDASTKRMQDIIDAGGGPYIDGEGELYSLNPPDTSNMSQSMKDIFDIVMRTSSLGQVTAGIDGGGSKNLMESIDSMTDAFVFDTVKSACQDISNTMIKSLCNLQFNYMYRMGKLIDYPVLLVEERDEVVKQAKIIEGNKVINQDEKRTTFNIVKNDTNELESQIILDTNALDKTLSNNVDNLTVLIDKTLRPKMKEALEQITKNPRVNIQPFNLFDKNKYKDMLLKELERVVRQFSIEQAGYIENSFKLGNTTFEDAMNTTAVEYADKIAESYMKSSKIKYIVDNLIQESSNYIRDYAVKISSGFSIDDKQARLEGLDRAVKDVDELKGVDIKKIAENSVVKTFTDLSSYENKKILKDNKNYSIIRSGILEGQCEHCRERMGDKYTLVGDKYINDRGEELVIPDPKCVGMKYGNQCRCFTIVIPNNI